MAKGRRPRMAKATAPERSVVQRRWRRWRLPRIERGQFGMRARSYSLGSGRDGCASTFKRGGGGLAIGGGCRGGRSPRRQGRAAPILNASGSARWFDVAGQGLKSRSCRRRPRNRNCKPRPCERLTRANMAMVMLMWNIVWDIGCATYFGAADMEYKTGYRMC